MQSRARSLFEAVANVAVSDGVAVATQMIAFAMVGLQATFGQNLAFGLIFTVVSLVRSDALRRLFKLLQTTQFSRSEPPTSNSDCEQ